MPQIIKEFRHETPSERFGKAFSNLGREGAKQFSDYVSNKESERAELEAAERMGLDLRGLRRETRNQAFEQHFKNQSKKSDDIAQRFQDEQSYGKIAETFGNKFADLWMSAPVGGKTELLKHGIDAKLRGADLDQMLEGVQSPKMDADQTFLQEQKIPQMKNGQVSKEMKWPDFTTRPSGYSPKDWVNERKQWRSENAPVFQENKTNLKNSVRDSTAIKKLEKLNSSGKLPEGLESIMINPSTGEIYGLAQLVGAVSPETQEWVKEIARFQNRAKDAFGSRVTNFDLMSYMKQFPGLLNTPEGRSRIITMMAINNKLDQSYQKALSSIYNKYGLNGIPQEQADSLAQRMIEDETDRLTNEYLSLDEQNMQQESKQLSGRMVDVIGPDGQEYEVDEREVGMLPEGFKLK